MSVKKCVICCWPGYSSRINLSEGFVRMQTRNTAENGSGPGCHRQRAAQPSPGRGQSKQGEELAAHPQQQPGTCFAGLGTCPTVQFTFQTAGQGGWEQTPAPVLSSPQSLPADDPLWGPELINPSQTGGGAGCSNCSFSCGTSRTAAELGDVSQMCYPNLHGLHELLGGRENNIPLSSCLMNMLTLHYRWGNPPAWVSNSILLPSQSHPSSLLWLICASGAGSEHSYPLRGGA